MQRPAAPKANLVCLVVCLPPFRRKCCCLCVRTVTSQIRLRYCFQACSTDTIPIRTPRLGNIFAEKARSSNSAGRKQPLAMCSRGYRAGSVRTSISRRSKTSCIGFLLENTSISPDRWGGWLIKSWYSCVCSLTSLNFPKCCVRQTTSLFRS